MFHYFKKVSIFTDNYVNTHFLCISAISISIQDPQKNKTDSNFHVDVLASNLDSRAAFSSSTLNTREMLDQMRSCCVSYSAIVMLDYATKCCLALVHTQ